MANLNIRNASDVIKKNSDKIKFIELYPNICLNKKPFQQTNK